MKIARVEAYNDANKHYFESLPLAVDFYVKSSEGRPDRSYLDLWMEEGWYRVYLGELQQLGWVTSVRYGQTFEACYKGGSDG